MLTLLTHAGPAVEPADVTMDKDVFLLFRQDFQDYQRFLDQMFEIMLSEVDTVLSAFDSYKTVQ